MPERPKRRRNNKNKRKNNKNNNIEVNKSNIEIATESGASCSNENIVTTTECIVGDEIDSKNLICGDKSLDSQPENLDKSNQVDTNVTNEESVKTENIEIDLSEKYIVETPDQKSNPIPKLNSAKKSKSCDDDDSPKIVEITEDCSSQVDDISLPLCNSSNAIVTNEEPEIEWEKVDDLNLPKTEITKGILSDNCHISLNTAHCEQTKSLSSEEEISLRNYLHTLNLSTNPNLNTADIKSEIEQIINREIKYRLRRKGLAEEIFFERSGPSRSLAVIDEEGSGDSSKTSRRHSYLSDQKSDNDELEDEVFETKDMQIRRRRDTNFPQQNTFSRRLIPQQCIKVDAKIKEPEVSEARGDWKMETVEKITGAELVYLTDSSSSTSSVYDMSDDGDKGHETDVTVRMITPTIEVTDTESLLKNTFLSKCNESIVRNEIVSNKDVINEGDGMEKINQKNNLAEENESISESENSKKCTHEIEVLSTDDIKTNLFVKDISETEDFKDMSTLNKKNPHEINKYDLEIKVLKCELNDAINNLIKEVVSDSENVCDNGSKEMFLRQDSSSSLDSSQCTAKYNPTHSSLNDVSNFLQNETHEELNAKKLVTEASSHVKDVIQHVEPKLEPNFNATFIATQPSTLRDICLFKISSFPYGEKVLEELANVSKRLQDISVSALNYSNIDIQYDSTQQKAEENEISQQKSSCKLIDHTESKHVPPPVQPRKSSLKKGKEEQSVSRKPEKIYECLSPSQKMLMEKTNTVISEEDIFSPAKSYFEDIERSKIQRKRESDPSVIPMKSETGSRLLAFLRNTPAPKKLSLPILNDENYYQNPITTSPRSDSFSKRMLQELDASNNFKETKNNQKYTPSLPPINFKPIPPPKPRHVYTYESDSEFTDSSFRSIRSDKKVFHYSTGNLNEEIENDISTIQNMHRQCSNIRNHNSNVASPRRPSLPQDICDQQMEYIRQKEKEVEAEIRRLEREQQKSSQRRGPRAPMISEKDTSYDGHFDTNKTLKRDDVSIYPTSKNVENRKIASLFSSSEEELLREKMYTEYVNQMAEREKRKHHRVIKVTQAASSSNSISKSMPSLNYLDSKVNNRIEQEFISKAKERWNKLGIRDPEDERESSRDVYREPKVIEHKIRVIEDGEEKDVRKLPSHMQDFVRFTVKDKDDDAGSNETVMIAPTFKARSSSPAIWRPGVTVSEESQASAGPPPPPPPPVWSPSSTPQATRKFRPVHFEQSPPDRKKFSNSKHEENGCTSGSESEGRLRTSLSAPAAGLHSLGSTSRLPRAQNPTVTLLQKAREGQLQRGRNPQQEADPRLPRDRPSPPRGDPVHALRKEYASESEAERSDYERGGHKMAEAKKLDGIGSITKDGMPVELRSEAKDPSRWYKKMYDTIHKNKYDEDYVTIRYKNSRGETLQRPSSNRSQYAYFDPRSGYLSEPEGGRAAGRAGGDPGPRRRTASVQEEREEPPTHKYSTLASSRVRHEVYRNQPGRIEDYVPGKSSVIDKEAKQWWDEVMDIFDGQNESSAPLQTQPSPKEKKDLTSAILSKSNMARALKESGYESDSTLVFRRHEAAPLSPAERRAAYRDLQAGGEPPRGGFRSPAPDRHESPSRRYVESDVNIHYRCPVRHDPLPLVPERELARQQADHMKRLYREQRRNKYLQELQDMQNRRHQDNFMPSQKTIVPLNRYDEAEKIVAKALYTFKGQTSRELSFRKGDIINVRRQIDSNWYEGEVHGKVGLFPYNYVELMKGDGVQTLKKSSIIEGRARAKFDFIAQTNLELPLKKGEVVVLTRRIDHNWWEGRTGNKTGIFPDSYVTILQEPTQSRQDAADKPAAPPAHRYTPQHNSPALSNAPPATAPLPTHGYIRKSPSNRTTDLNNTEPLYVDTNAEAIPYRAMYKYRPQNPDELELCEGDTVHVLEKCDDGWYVGSSQRTGRFGTFPGNYVERI